MSLAKFIYIFLSKIANFAGFSLFARRIPSENSTYEPLFPYATYAPWLSDTLFNDTYNIIENHTLIDKYRCYELWQLVNETSKLHGALIEVGVWRGGSGAIIAKQAKLSQIRDLVYVCDTFAGVVKAGEKDLSYKGGEHADTSKETVEELFYKLKLDNTKILVGVFPDETGMLVSDKAFRFCHIDVDVYQSARDVLEWLWPKLVVGGIVVFDDYGFQGCSGVRRFVNEERCKKDRLVIYNINGHAVLIKISD